MFWCQAPDGSRVLAAFNPGAYSGSITTDLSNPLPDPKPNPALAEIEKKLATLEPQLQGPDHKPDQPAMQQYFALRSEQSAIERQAIRDKEQRFQGDWAARVINNGKVKLQPVEIGPRGRVRPGAADLQVRTGGALGGRLRLKTR